MTAMENNNGNLEQQLRALLEEARVVIPGVQTLLGFQLIAVFNQLFPKSMTHAMQCWHLGSMALTALAMILIMSPASYHRMASHEVSETLVHMSSQFLMAGMFVLAASICIDFQLIATVILPEGPVPSILTGILFVIFIGQWFILPKIRARGKT
jgi:hypothetical protein